MLYASGNTSINGNVKIPLKGIQKASIEGQVLRNEKIFSGINSTSSYELPVLPENIKRKIRKTQNIDSIFISDNITSLLVNNISNSFMDEALTFYSEGDYQMGDITANGKIGFFSKETIYLRNSCHLQDVIISGKNVIVEEGFTGNVQIFALDTIIIGKGSTLSFPSTLVLFNENVNPIYIEIGDSVIVNGTIIVNQENKSTKNPFLKVSDNALIRGQIYIRGTINLIGKIHGSLMCNDFFLSTKKAYYVDHLLDNEIDFFALPVMFCGIDFIKGYNDQIIEEY
jgi:hypothetical protein